MTVLDSHPIKNAPLKEHIEELTNKNQHLQFNLVFVVPPEIFQNFTKQPYLSRDNKAI